MLIRVVLTEMEMRKLHMGTMSYGADSMDEVAHQLALAFGGGSGDHGGCSFYVFPGSEKWTDCIVAFSAHETGNIVYRDSALFER